jgi:hypothetical protein
MKNYMMIKQEVHDFAAFQKAFDELKSARESHGLHDLGQYVSADEPNTIIVLLDVDDVSRAKEYWNSAVLEAGRKKAGIVGKLVAGVDQVWLTNGTVRSAIRAA